MQQALAPLSGALARACGGAAKCTSPAVEAALLRMSAATIDRKLAPYRRQLKPRGLTTTRPGRLLKPHVPVRTFTPWDERHPGFTELDLVAHCGEATHGEYLHSLSLVDVATAWFEPRAVVNRSQRRVFEALTIIRDRLPFPLLGIDADNDSAFINTNQARTPYQRVLEAPEVSPSATQALRALYQTLNPVQVRRELERHLATLWRHGLHSGGSVRQRAPETQVSR
ncbi:MAG: hypothetical protein RB145_00370 [Armatimonadota bacterium]|nr:hypothetical protein [Armatimonadota bacterium]